MKWIYHHNVWVNKKIPFKYNLTEIKPILAIPHNSTVYPVAGLTKRQKAFIKINKILLKAIRKNIFFNKFCISMDRKPQAMTVKNFVTQYAWSNDRKAGSKCSNYIMNIIYGFWPRNKIPHIPKYMYRSGSLTLKIKISQFTSLLWFTWFYSLTCDHLVVLYDSIFPWFSQKKLICMYIYVMS